MAENNQDYLHEFSFIKIYDQNADRIFRHIYFRLQDRERALELMQDTFLKTFVYLKTGKTVENMVAFLYKVANNLLIDEYKKNKPQSLDEMRENFDFDPGNDEFIEIKKQLDADSIIELVGKIPHSYQTVVVMRYVDDLAVKEIAKILGESENGISVKIHRGLNYLRKLINNYGKN